MALPLGQCCIFGAAFSSECAASVHATGPCGKTLPGRSGGSECAASVPCECTNNITSTGVTQAESDAKYAQLPERLALGYSFTQADFQCCMWAGGKYSDDLGCDRAGGFEQRRNREFGAVFREYASDSWGPICEYGGARGGSFVNCQLSCYRNGFTPDGWEAACAMPPPSSPPGLPSQPASPPRRLSIAEQVGIFSGTSSALPLRAGVQPWGRSSVRMCCPSGSTYDALGYVGTECVGPSLSSAGSIRNVMKIAAVACSCRDLCDRTSDSGSCSDRVAADEDLHADGDLVARYGLCDSWASAMRPEPDAVRLVNTTLVAGVRVRDEGWMWLCSASDFMPTFSFYGFSGSSLLLARQTWRDSSWSKCMYSCHVHGYTHDQWITQCAWPSPPPSPSAPLPLSLVTPLPLPSLSPDSSPDGCGSGCIGSILSGALALIVFLCLFFVHRFYPGISFCRLFKYLTKEEDRRQLQSLRTEDVSLQTLGPLMQERQNYAQARSLRSASDSFPTAVVEPTTTVGVPPTDPPLLTADTATATAHDISASEIVIGQILGQGGMGKVFAATWNGSDVAVKVVKANWGEASDCPSLRTEVTVLSHLRFSHPRLVSFFGTTSIAGGLGIVMDYMANGSLYDRLELGGRKPKSPSPHKKLDAAVRYRIAQETAAGIAHLHRIEFMHRDVKTAK